MEEYTWRDRLVKEESLILGHYMAGKTLEQAITIMPLTCPYQNLVVLGNFQYN